MSQNQTVLIVEDDQDFAASLKLVVSLRDYAVQIVHSGEEALQVFDPTRHKIVLMDLRLPDINGVETMMRLRDQVPDIPVLIMTGCEQSSKEAVLARTAGATDLLFKPFKIKYLLDTIDSILLTEPLENR